MVFAQLTRRKHSPRRDTMSGARGAPRLSSFIFFYPWLAFISFRESNSHQVSEERELSVQRRLRILCLLVVSAPGTTPLHLPVASAPK